MEILGKPNAHQLMSIVACVGLAQNFGALRALTTSGIQAGHMKMHLNNILSQFHATELEIEKAVDYFKDNVISVSSVRSFVFEMRSV